MSTPENNTPASTGPERAVMDRIGSELYCADAHVSIAVREREAVKELREYVAAEVARATAEKDARISHLEQAVSNLNAYDAPAEVVSLREKVAEKDAEIARLNSKGPTDCLRMDYINSLPQPFIAHFYGGDEWLINDIEVQTGMLRIDVCGKLQVMHIRDVKYLRDADGHEHDSETLYTDYEKDAEIGRLKQERDALQAQVGVLREALATIASYDKESGYGPGACPYGCDTPHIASTALATTLATAASEVAELRKDKERLDKLQSLGTPGLGWTARESVIGRGYRLHQDPHVGIHATPRAAIDAAVQQSRKERA